MGGKQSNRKQASGKQSNRQPGLRRMGRQAVLARAGPLKNQPKNQLKNQLKNQRGQIALFIVLIFQALFILFAMTLNVALTVHDKINFQNALDLGALYGAKKQAEALNAIAHINFQMRQNYKLLAWRYRILGSLTQVKGGSSSAYWCPQNDTDTIPCTAASSGSPSACSQAAAAGIYPGGYCDIPYGVCISADTWQRGKHNGDENLCKNRGITIPPITDHPSIAPFLPWVTSATNLQQDLARAATASCDGEGTLNWLMANLFMSHFRLDQKDRKMMIEALYNKTLKEGKDLEGNFIEEGVKKTVAKNLSFTNDASFDENTDLSFYNSARDGPISFRQFLRPRNTFPVLMYLYFPNSGGSVGGCGTSAPNIFPHYRIGIANLPGASPPTLTGLAGPIRTFITSQWALFKYNGLNFTPNNYGAMSPLAWSYSKNPDRQIYYGVRGQITQSAAPQLFFPGNSPATLKGSAFAKPFGGRIGPEIDDRLIPPNISPGGSVNPIVLQPNYSRYPGDQWGLIDRRLHAGPSASLIKISGLNSPGQQMDPRTSPYNISYLGYLNLVEDPLARKPSRDPDFLMRMAEMMAVFPDVYDLINYSISNNYMETYFPKICHIIGEGGGPCQPDPAARKKIIGGGSVGGAAIGYIRGDFGWPESDRYWQKNRALAGISNSFLPFFYAGNSPPDVDLSQVSDDPPVSMNPTKFIGSKSRQPYMLLDPAHLLTQWASTTSEERYMDYKQPSSIPTFSKCHKQTPLTKDTQIPSGCVEGGRSGYSVKLVSCSLVKSSLNPKPADISEYCPN